MAGHMFPLLTMKLSCIAMRQSNPDITAGLPNILLKFLPYLASSDDGPA